ncbi:hypothetical protein NDU88_007336 [Pleurodeles waltl]|uniref:Uncharacterized protein n=1 Tax=Pleurodeles waltl TaxID=8319 RepID=A0AAV7U154_PLEWA|nr:hypothetical protein NDU88_007336 [Pleurodeles waltl]
MSSSSSAQTSEPSPNAIPDTRLESTTPSAPQPDKLDLVLEAIEHPSVSMEARLSAMTNDISFLRDDHHKLTNKVVEGEKQMTTLQSIVKDNQRTIQELRDWD